MSIQPMKFITTKWRTVWAKRKSAKARSGEMDKKSPLFCGLIWIRRHTAGKKVKLKTVGTTTQYTSVM